MSLVVQWLRLWAPNAGDSGSIPGWGTKIQHGRITHHFAKWSGQKEKRD